MRDLLGSVDGFPRIQRAWVRAALPYAVVVASVLVVYANALPAGFVLDDPITLRIARSTRTASDFVHLFTTPQRIDMALAPVETVVYRPFYLAYAAVAYRVWGSRAWAWHGANILLHALAACLVLVTLRRLFGLALMAALLAALLWAVHPVHVQAVTWVTAVAYLLCGIFLLIAVLVTCGWWPSGCGWPARALVASGALLISVLNHELGVAAPALALLVLLAAPGAGWAWGRRPDRGTAATAVAMGATALLYVVLRFTLIGTGEAGHLGATARTLGTRLLTAPEILLRYLGLLAYPARLTFDRSQDIPVPSGALDGRVLLTWALCALLLGGIALLARRVPVVACGAAWFLLAYLPASNTLIPLYSVMGEQYIYVASVGLVAAAVAAAQVGARRLAIPRAAMAAAILLLAYGTRTIVRTLDWRDDLSFSLASVAASPRSALSHNNLGNSYFGRGELGLGEREYGIARQLNPAAPKPHYNLGTLAMARGRLDEAEAPLRRAIALQPDYTEAYYNLAVVAHRKGRAHEAMDWLERASALPPGNAETDLLLGLTFLGVAPDRAPKHFRRFLAQAPDHPQAPAVRAMLEKLPAASPR